MVVSDFVHTFADIYAVCFSASRNLGKERISEIDARLLDAHEYAQLSKHYIDPVRHEYITIVVRSATSVWLRMKADKCTHRYAWWILNSEVDPRNLTDEEVARAVENQTIMPSKKI